MTVRKRQLQRKAQIQSRALSAIHHFGEALTCSDPEYFYQVSDDFARLHSAFRQGVSEGIFAVSEVCGTLAMLAEAGAARVVDQGDTRNWLVAQQIVFHAAVEELAVEVPDLTSG